MAGNQIGRPPLYKAPEDLRAAVEAYFTECEGVVVPTENGKCKTIGEIPPTISGLSYALGFKDRRSFTEQGKRGSAFMEVVRYARLRVEAYNEAKLYDPNSYRGARFVLRNCFGWEVGEAFPDTCPTVVVTTVSDTVHDQEGNERVPAHNSDIRFLD